jgi:hypothetical protein
MGGALIGTLNKLVLNIRTIRKMFRGRNPPDNIRTDRQYRILINLTLTPTLIESQLGNIWYCPLTLILIGDDDDEAVSKETIAEA